VPTNTFTYSEDEPINYRDFVLWLFYENPNLNKWSTRSARKTFCYATIELSFGVDESTAKQLCEDAVRLGFLDDWDESYYCKLEGPEK